MGTEVVSQRASTLVCAIVVAVAALPAQSVPDVPGSFHQLRRELRKAAAASRDVALLRRAAEIEDISGPTAPEAYQRLAQALEQSASASPDYMSALERGLTVSLRENDPQRAAWFEERLRAAGAQKSSPAMAQTAAPRRNGLWIPGGLQALAIVARSKENSSPERFLADYSRAIVENTSSEERQAAYTGRLRHYFQRVEALAALGTRKENRVNLTVSGQSRNTERILNLLGWKMRSLKNRPTMEADEKTAQGRRQESAVALALDAVAMQQALDSGKAFSFDLVSEWVPVLLEENRWRQFYASEKLPGGFAEALAKDPRRAKVYAGLSALDEATLSVLLTGIGLKELVEKHASLLYQYSSALALGNRGAEVPGGEEAEPAWEELVGANPRRPGDFFRRLIEKDQGRMLAFFFTLSHLDLQRQRFCTRSAARLSRFYGPLRAVPGLLISAAAQAQDSAWIELLREIPLDSEGSVHFPGGPQVWLGAEGASHVRGQRVNAPKSGAATTAQLEEEILLRLTRAYYVRDLVKRSELQNLLAVVRLQAHRSAPLPPGAALLLAHNLAEGAGAYPYFATLIGLADRHFERFFALRDRLRSYSPLELNQALGQLHALLEMLCLLQQSRALDPQRSAELFDSLCQRFASAGSAGEWANASLEFVQRMIPTGAPDPDEALRTLLLGKPAPVSFEWNGARRVVDVAKIRHAHFQAVLEAQNVPSLATVFQILDAAQNLAMRKGDAAEHIRTLEVAAAKLPSLEIPKGVKGRERQNLEAFQNKRIAAILVKLREQIGTRQEASKLAQELLTEASAQVTLALAGIVYAYFLNPDDLLVSEDPLLLRKHQFVPLSPSQVQAVFHGSELFSSSAGAGSYFTGGFADFSAAAGQLAVAGTGQNERNSGAAFGAQVAANRGADWKLLQDDDLRLLGLKIRVAREWMVQAAGEPALRSDLGEALLGLLSLSRRAKLLNGLRARDWVTVWEAVSLSDVYLLGDAYLQRYRADPWRSPVTVALRQASARNDGSRLEFLGSLTRVRRQCSHPHLLRLGPYEEYERYLHPSVMAERLAELKLYLAEHMDRAGLPAPLLGLLAEPVAEIVFQRVQMTDAHDWRSALAAFRELNDEILEEALGRL